ncbi:MAG: penicillin-binding protein 2 [bacterium]|nr:penicillin-binding protein 2 [bacterium]
MSVDFAPRLRLITVLCILAAFLLVGKLYLLQIVHGSEYREKAKRQYTVPQENLFDRGTIFFETRNGIAVTAAGVKTGFILAIRPKEVTDAEGTYVALSTHMELSREEFLRKAGKKDDPYEEIARRIAPEVAEKLEAANLPGVQLYKDRWRFYPGGGLAAHALGFVGWQGDVQAGRYGLERYYDDVLSRDGETLYRNFFAEIFSDMKRTVEYGGTGDVITGIEPTVEQFLENELREVRTKFKAVRAGGIIMDPYTGGIYAMATSPSFDPNEFGRERDPAVYTNSLVEHVYEVGSIMKPLTLAAGLDAGVITATTTYYDAGFLTLNTETITNFDGKGRGRVNMQEVLNQSLNTGAATVALKLGRDRFVEYFTSFGFGEETGIDLPNEVAGLVKNLEGGRDIELATASYGQGIALTPIQTVRALASLGNGGFLPAPHLAKQIKYRVGVSRSVGGFSKKQVFSKETSEEITRMLVEVVDKALRGGADKFAHYSIAAKTGTALLAREGGRGYYDDRFLHSFFGYFPAYNPRFIIFLYLLDPQGVTFASHTLPDPFFSTVKFLINYYEIPPDR